MKRKIVTISEDEILKDLIKDKEFAKKTSRKSTKYTDWICPVCKTEKRECPAHIIRRGFNCKICKDPSSYSERVMRQLLKDNNIVFEEQKKFEDCVSKKELPFDFYIKEDGKEFCIEMQGGQHFEKRGNSKWDLENIQLRDKIKKKYCLDNNIIYVDINAEKSHLQTLLKNIKDSLIGEHISNIDTDSIKKAIITNFKDIDTDYLIKRHKEGASFLKIEKETDISRKTIVSILEKLGEYTPRNGEKNNGKEVILLNTSEVFPTATEAAEFMGFKTVSNIASVCRGKRKYAGKINGEKAKWMYYQEYLKQMD